MNPHEMNPQDIAKLQDAFARNLTEETTPSASPVSASQASGMRDRIKALEDELSGIPREAIKAQGENLQTYLDEYGQETFYVRNISGTHVVISDIDMDPVPKGKCMDLLTLKPLEDLKKSRDLRNATSPYSKKRLLQRLTPQEYYEAMETEVANQKKIAILREQLEYKAQQQQERMNADPYSPPPTSSSNSPDRQKVRAEIHSKLGKLNLLDSKDPERMAQAMTSVEFVEWVFASNLTTTEIEFILGDPIVSRNSDIRTALLQKRASIPS